MRNSLETFRFVVCLGASVVAVGKLFSNSSRILQCSLQFPNGIRRAENPCGFGDDRLQENALGRQHDAQLRIQRRGDRQFHVYRYRKGSEFLPEFPCLVEYSISGKFLVIKINFPAI